MFSSLAIRGTALIRERPILRFIVLLGLLMAVFYASLPMLNRWGTIPAYLSANAHASAAILRLFGYSTVADGVQVTSPRFAFEIKQGCDASEPIALFVASVIGFRAGWGHKLAGILLGTVILALANLLRILALFFTGVYWPRLFEFMHLDVCQALFIVLTLALWIAWALWALRAGASANHIGDSSAPIRSSS